MVNHMSEAIGTSRWVRVRSFLSHEFQEMLPPTMFFFIGFNLILFTKRLFLADYLIQFSGFMIATTSALVVGKTVLLANMMPFMRRFDHGPLVQPILFKTMVYTLSVFVVRLLEPPVQPLGVLSEWPDNLAPAPARVGPSGSLVLISDGIFEASNGAGEQFGIDRVVTTLDDQPDSCKPGEIIAALRAAVRVWQGSADHEDDQTIVVVQRDGA